MRITDATIVSVTTKQSDLSRNRPYKQVELMLDDGIRVYDNCVLDHEYGLHKLEQYRSLRRGRRIGVRLESVLRHPSSGEPLYVKSLYRPSPRVVLMLHDIARYLERASTKIHGVANVLNGKV